MTAAQLLAELRSLGVEVEAVGLQLFTRPPGAVRQALRPLLVEHRDALVDLASRSCPGCGEVDYLPLAQGWRRCWACGSRWGAGPDPGDPPELQRIADLLGVVLIEPPGRQPGARRPGWSIGAVLGCPSCGNRACSTAPAGRPHRRCDGPRGCGQTWNPEAL